VVPLEEKDDEKDDEVGLEALLALDKGDGKGMKEKHKKSKGESKGGVVPMDSSNFPDEEDDSVVKRREKLVEDKGEKIKCEYMHIYMLLKMMMSMSIMSMMISIMMMVTSMLMMSLRSMCCIDRCACKLMSEHVDDNDL